MGLLYQKLIKRTYILPSKDTRLTQEGKDIFGIKNERIFSIDEEIAWWHDCIYIHKLFINNIQDVINDDDPYILLEEDLRKLIEICKQIEIDSFVIKKFILIDDNKIDYVECINQIKQAKYALENAILEIHEDCDLLYHGC